MKKNVIIYQSPDDGETYVPERTTLIIRPDFSLLRNKSSKDFSFTVHGDASGYHTGNVLISDDNQTIIFKPALPFALNEAVLVKLEFPSAENISPVSYTFHITPITDSEQYYVLNLLREKELADIFLFPKTDEAKYEPTRDQGIPLDTLPPRFPVIMIDTLDPAAVAADDISFAPAGSNCITIIDNSGKPLFARQVLPTGAMDFKPEPHNTLSYFATGSTVQNNVFIGKEFLLNRDYVAIDSFQCGNGYNTDFHDFQLLPNGHALIISYDTRDTDMRIVTGNPNAAKKSAIIGAIIQELDTQKNVIFQWRSWDHLQITDMSNFDLTNPNHGAIDYAHLNSVELDTDGNIIASFRAMDDVVKINRVNPASPIGSILWRWGGKDSTINRFIFIGDTLPFSGQHDVRRIANGHITMLDNGNYRKTKWGNGTYHDTAYSRAIEYDLDEKNFTATAVWQYGDIPTTPASGNVQRLSNGNTFIGLGQQNHPNVLEVTSSGKKVFQLSLPNNPYNYRAFRFEWPPKLSGVITASEPQTLIFSSIYPDPAINTAILSFATSKTGLINIEILDIFGNRLIETNEENLEPGEYSRSLDLGKFPSGTYYCKLSQNGTFMMKMLVVQK